TTNGAEALESWLSAKSADTPYDLVLMDIQMPQLNGIETTKRIRTLEAGEPGGRTPILALTANTLVEDRYACFEAGMDGFLIKPLDREKLAEALAGLIASRHIAARGELVGGAKRSVPTIDRCARTGGHGASAAVPTLSNRPPPPQPHRPHQG